MRADSKTFWYIIINPHAGSGKTMSEWAVAETRLAELEIPYVAVMTSRKFHATELAYAAAAKGYRRILAVGGDGSVHEVLTGIMKYVNEWMIDPLEFYFGVIPIGSGNDWIKSLNVPHDTKTVIDLLQEESFTRQDIVKVETTSGVNYMANIGGVGFDSRVCDRVNMQKSAGKRSERIYVSALIYTIFRHKPFDIKIVCDGKTVYEGPALSLAMGNGKYSGGGMQQVPLAVMDDGKLDVMLVPKVPLSDLLREMPRLFNATINESDKVFTYRCSTLEVTSDSEQLVEVDGEIEGSLPLKVTLPGQRINVLCGE